MQYNNHWAKERYHSGTTMDYLFFWGHQPRNMDQPGAKCLSQWFARAFEYQGVLYQTAEHWMMAEKARLFGDEAACRKIVNSPSPKAAKAIGRTVRGFDEPTWMANRDSIVRAGNYLKFKQNRDLWKYLDSTGDKILVEASPYDRIWGIGMKAYDRGVENPHHWRGLNLLGYALMEVRDQLRKE